MSFTKHISSTQPETAMGWCARRTGDHLAALVVPIGSSLRFVDTLDPQVKPASAVPGVRPNALLNQEVGA